MKKVILITAFAFAFVFLISVFSIDACMDAGGAWSDFGFTCHIPRENFVPQYMRPAPVFWGLVVFLSSMFTLLVNKIIPK
ncbi:hypothetical protein FE810_13090 [Thalassotalea litorea]|uniref:Uncharacterized protein n=1 Tax=Thalassotalea litorea TaxID=2020715 RepID=A0A5R9IL11_9GAMM|nr:hypothetical protein [Thalassotalea litorea]TLU61987.1 hypothetical protein FE810_13090 [Thalassotalea litorea]